MAGERLPARFSLCSQLWVRGTGKCFELKISAAKPPQAIYKPPQPIRKNKNPELLSKTDPDF
jgi:hypothetical protein